MLTKYFNGSSKILIVGRNSVLLFLLVSATLFSVSFHIFVSLDNRFASYSFIAVDLFGRSFRYVINVFPRPGALFKTCGGDLSFESKEKQEGGEKWRGKSHTEAEKTKNSFSITWNRYKTNAMKIQIIKWWKNARTLHWLHYTVPKSPDLMMPSLSCRCPESPRSPSSHSSSPFPLHVSLVAPIAIIAA